MNQDCLGYVIKAKEDNIFHDAYIGQGDCFVAKIKTAIIYKDDMLAGSELRKICKRNEGFEAYDETLLEIIPVMITEVSQPAAGEDV